jgi:hypothetical protein
MGVDLETPLENLAAAGDHIQITARGLGVNDLAATILQLFKTAAATLFTKGIPLFSFSINGSIGHGVGGEEKGKTRSNVMSGF